MIKRTYQFLFGFLLVSLLGPFNLAHAWSLHYLITDRALQHPAMKFTDALVPVEALEDFLKDQRQPLKKLYAEYYDWLSSHQTKRFKRMVFNPETPTTEMFLKAGRLNPTTSFALVNRILPGNKRAHRRILFDVFFKRPQSEESFFYQAEDVSKRKVSIRSVLTTFSDEPDWGMDQHLWDVKEYGFGDQPYGPRRGMSSRAAFHMQFAHENYFVKTFAPEMLDGMVYERIELFKRLATLAFKTNHPYWGYRFVSWAVHYVQDVGQPYHAKAVPSAGLGYYLRFAASTDKKKMKAETTQMVKNRHYLYEEFVGIGLQRSYTTDNPISGELSQYLTDGVPFYKSVTSEEDLFRLVMEEAANHSAKIDKAIIKTFGSKRTEDPSYSVEADPNHDMLVLINELKPKHAERILRETGNDFEVTGRATRTMVKLLAVK